MFSVILYFVSVIQDVSVILWRTHNKASVLVHHMCPNVPEYYCEMHSGSCAHATCTHTRLHCNSSSCLSRTGTLYQTSPLSRACWGGGEVNSHWCDVNTVHRLCVVMSNGRPCEGWVYSCENTCSLECYVCISVCTSLHPQLLLWCIRLKVLDG